MERRLARFAHRLTDDQDMHDDLLQEALIMLWQLDVLYHDWSDRKFRRYVFRTLCNRMRNIWRCERARRVTWAPAFENRRQARAVLLADL
jgi:DNA-directed RNA polymerase specialized sigma24 family protein